MDQYTKAVSNVASGVAFYVKVYTTGKATIKINFALRFNKNCFDFRNGITERNKGGGVQKLPRKKTERRVIIANQNLSLAQEITKTSG